MMFCFIRTINAKSELTSKDNLNGFCKFLCYTMYLKYKLGRNNNLKAGVPPKTTT